MTIGDQPIGAGASPFVVAELSGNHNGDLGRALALMEAAKEAGADAVKLQTYTPDTMTIDCDRPEFRVTGGLWDGYTLYDLYRWAHTPWDWHEPLFAKGHDLGITVFSTPFDASAVDFLEQFDPPAYKIASFENTDLALVTRVVATGRPVIVSTGMASLRELDDLVQTARQAGCRDLALLHCVSAYPARSEEANLRTIPHLAEAFQAVVGLSDHTPGTAVAVVAIALGAAVVEKHLTLNRADGGPDAAFSLEPDELAALVAGCRDAHAALGKVSYERTRSEEGSVIFRRSVFAVADIAKGEPFTERNLRAIRPGHGLAPRHLADVIGRHATRPVARGEPLRWDAVGE